MGINCLLGWCLKIIMSWFFKSKISKTIQGCISIMLIMGWRSVNLDFVFCVMQFHAYQYYPKRMTHTSKERH